MYVFTANILSYHEKQIQLFLRNSSILFSKPNVALRRYGIHPRMNVDRYDRLSCRV